MCTVCVPTNDKKKVIDRDDTLPTTYTKFYNIFLVYLSPSIIEPLQLTTNRK